MLEDKIKGLFKESNDEAFNEVIKDGIAIDVEHIVVSMYSGVNKGVFESIEEAEEFIVGEMTKCREKFGGMTQRELTEHMVKSILATLYSED